MLFLCLLCSGSLLKMKELTVLAFIVVSSFRIGCTGQTDIDLVTYSTKADETLPCMITGNPFTVQWIDDSVSGDPLCTCVPSTGNVTVETSNEKYDNFRYTATCNLIITAVEKDDGGNYLCVQAPGGTQATYNLTVEVVSNVVISYDGTGVVEVGTTYTFICTAQGVRSPSILQLIWSTDDSTDDSGTTRDVNEDDNSLEDLTSTYILRPKQTDTFIRCSITGYKTQQELSDTVITQSLQLEVQYVPECTLSMVKEEDCTQITLNCDCIAKPDVHGNGYSFYQNDTLIQDSEMDSSITVDVDLDSTTVFYCTATNDVGDGSASNKKEHECSSNPPFKWWIILIVILVVAGVGIGVAVCWYFFKRPSTSSKGNNDDNTDGNRKNSTNSDPPEYAAVSKPLKTEPKAAPRSSAPSAGGEQLELQYAAIDHGDRVPSNEIRQPEDAPTEYATVQVNSIIV